MICLILIYKSEVAYAGSLAQDAWKKYPPVSSHSDLGMWISMVSFIQFGISFTLFLVDGELKRSQICSNMQKKTKKSHRLPIIAHSGSSPIAERSGDM